MAVFQAVGVLQARRISEPEVRQTSSFVVLRCQECMARNQVIGSIKEALFEWFDPEDPHGVTQDPLDTEDFGTDRLVYENCECGGLMIQIHE